MHLVGICLRRLAFPCALSVLLSAPYAAAAPPDGSWSVTGRGVMGTGCGDWVVRLTTTQGHLSGIVGLGDGNVPLQNLRLSADGSFSGNTQATWIGGVHLRAFQVRGRFVGDAVNLTLENQFCHARSGSARRMAG